MGTPGAPIYNPPTTPRRPGAWHEQGACRKFGQAILEDPNSDPFFHPPGETGRPKAERIQAAKAVCAACPVLAQCRTYALDTKEEFGIWGGLSEDEREALRSGKPLPDRELYLEPVTLLPGRKPRTLEPAMVSSHVRALVEAGFNSVDISRMAGVTSETVRKLAKGTTGEVYLTTAEKLLSVKVRRAVAA